MGSPTSPAGRITKLRRTALLVALFIAIAAAFVGFPRYTSLGIFAAGGGRYWVARAAQATSSAEAKAHLLRVLQINQYGVNVAEQGVRALSNHRDRIRMWQYLVELAPNENWRGIYSRDLQAELAEASAK